MPRKKRAPWIKLYGDYTATPSHAELDDRALWIGVVLMQLIRAGCDAREDREPWALRENGSPCSLTAIAQRARQTIAVARRGLGMLVEAGTVALREDGAYGMPRFWEHQDPKIAEELRAEGVAKRNEGRWVYFAFGGGLVKIGCSANPWARVQALRTEVPGTVLAAKERGGFDRERELHETYADLRVRGEWFRYEGALRSYVDALRSTTVVELQQEGRGESSESSLRSDSPVVPNGDNIAKPPILTLAIRANDPPKAKKGGKSKPRTDYPEGLAEHFLAALQAACETLGKRGPRKVTDHHRDHLRKLYAAQEPTPEDVSHVVAVRRAMDARGEAYGSLTWESICVPANFARWLATPLDAAPAKPKRDEEAPFGRRPLTGKPYTSAQDREEWQRVDAANARRTEALRGGR